MANFTLNAYLHFNGNAEEVLNFYKSVLGGELTISRYGDNPQPDMAEDQKNLIMHGDLIGEGFRLMVSDSGPMGDVTPGTNFGLSLSGTDPELKTLFEKLSEGGKVTVPMAVAPWGDEFGMVEDKFGTSWLVNITKA